MIALTLLCRGSAPRNAPAERQEGCAAAEGLVGEQHRRAGKLVLKPSSSLFFLKCYIGQMHLPAGWDRLTVDVVFVLFWPFQAHLAPCAESQFGKSILSPIQPSVLPLSSMYNAGKVTNTVMGTFSLVSVLVHTGQQHLRIFL